MAKAILPHLDFACCVAWLARTCFHNDKKGLKITSVIIADHHTAKDRSLSKTEISQALSDRWAFRGYKPPTSRSMETRSNQDHFKGFIIWLYACGSMHLQKLLGSYEKELHAAILETLKRNPKRAIDVSAAEGYYAVGYAIRPPDSNTITLDTDPKAKKACKELTSLNNVSERTCI